MHKVMANNEKKNIILHNIWIMLFVLFFLLFDLLLFYSILIHGEVEKHFIRFFSIPATTTWEEECFTLSAARCIRVIFMGKLFLFVNLHLANGDMHYGE